jgi:hypothetical protein
MGIRQKSAVHFGGVLMLWLAILVSAFFGKRMVEQLLPKRLWRKVRDDIKVLADRDRGLTFNLSSLQLIPHSYE